MLADSALAHFADELVGPTIALDRAALVMGGHARAVDVGSYLARLDGLAAAARVRGFDDVDTIASLFGGDALAGNRDQYYDPRNSILAEVLDRGLGIPITLCVIAIEVGRRLDIAVEGVPFPGHFLIRVRDGTASVLLDPFCGGRPISDEELLRRLQATTGRIAALGPRELGVATIAGILARMLQNLKVIYLKSEDFERGLAIQERICLVCQDDPRERRDRGLIHARLNRAVEAEADLSAYLEACEDAADSDRICEILEQMHRRRGPAN